VTPYPNVADVRETNTKDNAGLVYYCIQRDKIYKDVLDHLATDTVRMTPSFRHGYREFNNEIRVRIINDCWIGAQVNSEWRRPHVPKVERIDLEENCKYRISLDRV
jgi:hypothetical protein